MGRYIALKNCQDSEITFIPFPAYLEQLKCIKVSPDQKMLAISYTTKTEQIPHLSIYQMEKRKKESPRNHNVRTESPRTFRHHETKSSHFLLFAFSRVKGVS